MSDKIELPPPNAGFIGFPNIPLQEQVRIINSLNRVNDPNSEEAVRNMQTYLSPRMDEITQYSESIRRELSELDHLYHNGCTPEEKRQIGIRIHKLKGDLSEFENFRTNTVEQ